MKKLLILFLAIAVVFSLAACKETPGTPSNDDEKGDNGANTECPGHFDNDGDGYCDACDEEYTPEETGLIDFTVTLKDENGTTFSGVTVELIHENGNTVTAVTSDNGSATLSVVGGSYTVIATEGLPENHYADMKIVDVSEANTSVELTVIDNTPDGSEEKPYGVTDTETEFKLTSGVSACFYMRNVSVILKVIGTNIKLTLGGEEYTPDNGKIELVTEVIADGSPYVTIDFTVTNLSDSENTVSLYFDYLPGTSDNPFAATAGEDITAEVPIGGTVYYLFTATKTGILMLSTQDASASIMLYNLTAGAVTSYTSGGAVCIFVNEGDEVSVPVASLGTDAVNSVTFRLTEAKADSTEPLTLALGTTELTVKSGSCVTFTSAGANEITVDASGVTVTKNGEAVLEGSFTAETGDVIVIENTSDGGADVIITAALPTDGETGEA